MMIEESHFLAMCNICKLNQRLVQDIMIDAGVRVSDYDKFYMVCCRENARSAYGIYNKMNDIDRKNIEEGFVLILEGLVKRDRMESWIHFLLQEYERGEIAL